MENKVALLFIHRGMSDYLLYCLEQAKVACPSCRIILLGDESNKIQDPVIEHYLISDYFESADEFEKVYRHQSSNQYWFELICFQRWFIIKDFCQKNNITQCFGCDTDLLIYDDLTKYIPDSTYKLTIANKNGPQCSFFTNNTISEFCDYIMKQYTDTLCSERLLKRYKGFIDNKLPGGNCDMTMFQLFDEDFPGAVLDCGFMTPELKDKLIYCCSTTYDWIQTEIKKGLKIAKLQFTDDKPYLFDKEGKKYMVPVIHFWGPYKKLMYDYSTVAKDVKDSIKKKFSQNQLKKKIKFLIKQFLPYGLVNHIKK